MSGFQSPNHTQTPNDLFDIHMKEMSNPELRVVLAIVRQTVGFHRNKTRFSVKKLMEMTGMKSRNSVVKGAKEAEGHGFIERLNPDEQGSAEWGLVCATPSKNEPLPLTDCAPTRQSVRDSTDAKESIKESIKESFAQEQKAANSLSSEISDDEFWEKKNAEKDSVVKKPLTTEKQPIPGIEAAMFSERPVTDEDMAADRGDTLDFIISEWYRIVSDADIIVLKKFCDYFGKIPPKPKRGKKQPSIIHTWKAGINNLRSLGGDLSGAMQELAAGYSDEEKDKYANNPNSIVNSVFGIMSKTKTESAALANSHRMDENGMIISVAA